MSQMMMAVRATSQLSTFSETRTLPGGPLRPRARREIVPGTLGRFGSGVPRTDSGVCGAASARAPGKIPRKDLLRMSVLAFPTLYHFNQRPLGHDAEGIKPGPYDLRLPGQRLAKLPKLSRFCGVQGGIPHLQALERLQNHL